ncbi:collagen alpha-1(I) chain-like [Trichechus manatus latirostris]|uniref:Collagen alpha-1(I) chain-like n=1 Tax=Trichechus manatus latirostris TaxID=127582 RepID=A0A2Y9FZN7_TRIMA|nr:collagen alpha-1(I) chain-like [Trichechus manatus latirostris]
MQLPGDGVGLQEAAPTYDICGGRKRTSPPPKRSSAPSRHPRLPVAAQPAPPGLGKTWRGAHTKRGAAGEGARGGTAPAGLASLLGAARLRPPSNPAAPRPAPQIPARPSSRGLECGAGSGRKGGPGPAARCWGGAGSREPRQQDRESNSRQPGPPGGALALGPEKRGGTLNGGPEASPVAGGVRAALNGRHQLPLPYTSSHHHPPIPIAAHKPLFWDEQSGEGTDF